MHGDPVQQLLATHNVHSPHTHVLGHGLYGWGCFCVRWYSMWVFMLSWMFQHDYLVPYCFECLICFTWKGALEIRSLLLLLLLLGIHDCTETRKMSTVLWHISWVFLHHCYETCTMSIVFTHAIGLYQCHKTCSMSTVLIHIMGFYHWYETCTTSTVQRHMSSIFTTALKHTQRPQSKDICHRSFPLLWNTHTFNVHSPH